MDKLTYEVESSEDKGNLWSHSSEGVTVGRFSKTGIDVPHTLKEIEQGKPSYRLFTVGLATVSDWELFKGKAMEFWGVVVEDSMFNTSLLLPNA